MTPGSLPGAWAPGPCSPRSGAFPGGSARWCWRVALGKAHSSCTTFPGDILLPRTPPPPPRPATEPGSVCQMPPGAGLTPRGFDSVGLGRDLNQPRF